MKENKIPKSIHVVAVILTYVTVVPIYILYVAWCMLVMYNWFLLPLGLPVVTLWQLYGIGLTIALIFPRQTFIPKNRDNKLEVFTILGTPIINVIFGYIVKTFLI